jgi:hypothetical protein
VAGIGEPGWSVKPELHNHALVLLVEQLRLAYGFRAADAVEGLAEPGIRGDDYKGRVWNLSVVVVIRRYGDPVGDWRREVARVGAGLAVVDAVFAAVPDSREIVLEVLEVPVPGVGGAEGGEGSVNLGRRWAPGPRWKIKSWTARAGGMCAARTCETACPRPT